jgi:hypothetical protein
MYNTVFWIIQPKKLDAMFPAVFSSVFQPGFGIIDRFIGRCWFLVGMLWSAVAMVLPGLNTGIPTFFQTIKSLGTGNFMNVMPVDIENIGSIFQWIEQHDSSQILSKSVFAFKFYEFLFLVPFCFLPPIPRKGGR